MKRDAAATRARIFEAASAEFSQYGVAGARIDRISGTAKANKARIYEYFGDKEQLFATVLEAELNRLTTELPAPTDTRDIPEFVGLAFDYHQARPALVRLLHWEALHFGIGPIPGEAARLSFYRGRAALLQGGKEGQHGNSGLDARHLHFVLLTLATSWFGLPQLARMHVDGNPLTQPVLADHRKFIVEVVERILRSDSV